MFVQRYRFILLNDHDNRPGKKPRGATAPVCLTPHRRTTLPGTPTFPSTPHPSNRAGARQLARG